MKKSVIYLFLLFLFACSNSVNDPVNVQSESELAEKGHGRLVLNLNSRVLGISEIQMFEISVKGSGFAAMSQTVTVGEPVEFSVPVGANRIIVVEARDSYGELIPGLKMYGYADVIPASTTSVQVNWNTTPAGSILETLLDNYAFDISSIDTSVLQGLVDAASNKDLINIEANAEYFIDNLSFRNPLLEYNFATISGLLYENDGETLLESDFVVKVGDHLSNAVFSEDDGIYSVTNIVPGYRAVSVYSNGELIGREFITLDDGEVVSDFNIITSYSTIYYENGIKFNGGYPVPPEEYADIFIYSDNWNDASADYELMDFSYYCENAGVMEFDIKYVPSDLAGTTISLGIEDIDGRVWYKSYSAGNEYTHISLYVSDFENPFIPHELYPFDFSKIKKIMISPYFIDNPIETNEIWIKNIVISIPDDPVYPEIRLTGVNREVQGSGSICIDLTEPLE